MALFSHLVFTALAVALCPRRPNILVIVSDDVGWNDLDVHGSNEIPTPNLNKICSDGVRMTRHYGQCACSPTRASLMTGRNAITTGIYNPFPSDDKHLQLSEKLFPEYLNELGYESHMSGKWHLGLNVIDSLPTSRGFNNETYIGIWTGSNNQFTHLSSDGVYDFIDGTTQRYTEEYSHFEFTRRVIDTLESRYDRRVDPDVAPFFYYFAPQNNHVPWEAPDVYLNRPECASIADARRGRVCAMTIALDEAIGNITRTLDEIGQLANTIIIYTSDNGGVSGSGNGAAVSSNYPLRGSKFTLWEGGIRLMSCISGPGVPAGKTWDGLMHVSDWLPTVLEAIGSEQPTLLEYDGVSQWIPITTNSSSSREAIVIEAHRFTDPQVNGNAMIIGDLKLLRVEAVTDRVMVNETWNFPEQHIGTQVTVDCGGPPPQDFSKCTGNFCLFNITQDPCEYYDIRADNPELFDQILVKFNYYRRKASLELEGNGCTNPTAISSWGALVHKPCNTTAPTRHGAQVLERQEEPANDVGYQLGVMGFVLFCVVIIGAFVGLMWLLSHR